MHDSLKKGLTTAVATATMLWSVGAASFVAPLTAHAANAGDVIRGTTLSTLYYQGNDGKRYAFPNEKTYLSWYADFSGVQKISDSALAAIPLGGNVAYRPGARWIKIQSDPKTYAIAPNGSLRWIESESVASGLAGSDWNQFIDDVADVFFVDYTVGASLTSAANAYNGALVKAADGTYYVVQNGAKRKVTSAGFSANRLQSRLALDGSGINLSAMSSGSDVTGKEAWLSDAAQLPEQAIGGGLSVSLASDSPAAMSIPASATNVTLMKFNLSASSATTVNSIVVKQGGLGGTGSTLNVYLFDGNTRLVNARSVNSASREVNFSGLNLAMTAGQTKTLSVVADMALNPTAGDTVSFEIASASAIVGGSTVSGSFPVKGATMSVATQDVGGLTLVKSGSITNPTIGQKQAVIGEFKLTAGAEEGTKIQRIRLDVNEATSHSNYNLYQNNTLVAVGTRTASDKVDFVFTNPFEITQGNNKIFQLKADIGGQNGDDISVALEETTDIYAVGTKYGFGVTVTNTSYGTTNCTASSSNCSFSDVQGGKLTVAFNGPSASKFKVDQTGLVLMDLTVTSQNSVTVRDFDFLLSGSDFKGVTGNNYQNFRLVNKATGATVAGPEEFDTAFGSLTNSAERVSFSDDWSMNAGQSIDLQLVVDAKGDDGSLYDVAANDTITATWDQDGMSARDGNNDELTIANGGIVPGADLVGNAMTAQTSSLTVAVSQPPSSTTYVKGSNGVPMLGLSLTAGPASAVNVSALTLSASGETDTIGSWSRDVAVTSLISSCSIYDGVSGALVDGPESLGSSDAAEYAGTDNNVTFNGFAWPIPAGETGKLIAKCNVANGTLTSGGATDFLALSLNNNDDLTATDSEGDSVIANGGAAGDALTLNTVATDGDAAGIIYQTIAASGTLAFANAADAPTSTIILSNSTGVAVSKFKVTASTEDFLIKKLTVKVDANSGVLPAVSNVILEYKDQAGATKTASGVIASSVAKFDGLTMYARKDEPTFVTVKLNVGDVTTDNKGSGDVVDMELHSSTAAPGEFEANGLSSGTTLADADVDAGSAVTGWNVGGAATDSFLAPTGALHEIRKTKPTISLASGSPSGAGIPGLNEVLRFNVSADSRGAVTMSEITFGFNATDNNGDTASGNWQSCDGGDGDGTGSEDLGMEDADLNLYEASDMSTDLLGTGAANAARVKLIKSDKTVCADTEAIRYININLEGSSGTAQEIGAGATKTYILKIDSTNASASNDDSLRIDIVDEATASTSGGAMDKAIEWDDSNLTNTTNSTGSADTGAVDIDGDFIKNLPVTGGTIVY